MLVRTASHPVFCEFQALTVLYLEWSDGRFLSVIIHVTKRTGEIQRSIFAWGWVGTGMDDTVMGWDGIYYMGIR